MSEIATVIVMTHVTFTYVTRDIGYWEITGTDECEKTSCANN